MKNILKSYGDWILGGLGMLLFLSIVWIFSWGILLIGRSMSQAFGSLGKEKSVVTTFLVDDAKKLDFKGLSN